MRIRLQVRCSIMFNVLRLDGDREASGVPHKQSEMAHFSLLWSYRS